MADMTISRKCKDCGKPFAIAPSEQRFYQKNNLALPARCKSCRDARKAAKEAGKK
jgi:hypothetical protein